MSHRRSLRSGVLVFVVLLLVSSAHALTFPPLSGRVVDEAGILDAETEKILSDKLADLEAKSGSQLVVVTLQSLQGTSIEDFGYQLGRTWGLGEKARNNGAMLIVVPSERKVRIEIGYGLEGTLTDAVTRLIILNAISPRFRAGDFQGGVTRGVDDIIQVMAGDAEEFQRRAAQRPDHSPPGIDLGTIIIIVFVGLFIISTLRGSGGGHRLRRGGFGGPIVIPSGGSWSSGSSGGGFSNGGGFSGGGGSFGGGGSSGDW